MAWRSGASAAYATTVGWTSSVRGAAEPSVAAASTNPAANVPDGFMILQLPKAFGCRDTIQFGTLRFMLGDMLCAIDNLRNPGRPGMMLDEASFGL
jgi:hypothetical protein